MMNKVYVRPGDKVVKEMPYSEVCMHMKIAGQRFTCLLTGSNMVRVYLNADCDTVITPGEAGFYLDDKQGYYYYKSEDN